MNNERMRQRIDTDIQESSLLYPNLDINPNPKKREIKCKTAEKSILNDKKIILNDKYKFRYFFEWKTMIKICI